eukprot:TRINITY_DN11192_c0_g1_i2.p1 TRINITY_DN11192_c0_g1~~TRINITY_DN11192_c0_g1_i2.p1  ORF type:complete len:432 (+),score=45.49 TRINITY_DN11192_c0_g1_i2:98-1393(+)
MGCGASASASEQKRKQAWLAGNTKKDKAPLPVEDGKPVVVPVTGQVAKESSPSEATSGVHHWAVVETHIAEDNDEELSCDPLTASSSELSWLSPPTKDNRWKTIPGEDPRVEDHEANPILKASGVDWILGDPTVVKVGDELHLWASMVLTGIHHYRAPASDPSNFKWLGKSIPYPGAQRPCAVYEKSSDKVVLYYEQYHVKGLYQSSTIQWTEARVGQWRFNKAQEALQPELPWEKIKQQRVGNPFVFYNDATGKWRMYYSASAINLEDSRIPEPMFLGVAEASNLRGPWARLRDTPLEIRGEIPGLQILGIGSLKKMKLLGDSLASDIAICNRLTRDLRTAATGSTLSIVRSNDGGFTWETVVPKLIGPTLVKGNWKESYAYGFDTIADPTDSNKTLIYYNGRNGWAGAYETIGVSRFPTAIVTDGLSTN